MNIIHLLMRKDAIAGLEISDTALRFVLLNPKKISCEILLPEGIIRNGLILNKPKLIEAIAEVVKKSSRSARYVIASIPTDAIYSKIVAFPPSLTGTKLQDAIRLSADFQMPYKPDTAHIDWQASGDKNAHSFLICGIPKHVAEDYIQVLTHAGLTPVALESHAMSLLRAAEIPSQKTLLIQLLSQTSFSLYVIAQGVLRFSRSYPNEHVSVKSRDTAINQVKDFYESEQKPIDQVLKIADLKPQKGQWIISRSAALRGKLPRSEDTYISLMPIGTEKAYAYQKAITFSEFIAHTTIGISVFFSLIFFIAFIGMNHLHQKTLLNNTGSGIPTLPQDITLLQHTITQLNAKTAFAAAIIHSTPAWSGMLDELKRLTPPDIIITSVNLPAPDAILTLTGIASDRNKLTLYRKSLEDSALFEEVILPVANLEIKEKIPFSINFRLSTHL